MSTQQPLRIDRGTAERLLDGDRHVSPGDAAQLAGLLAAAGAPPRPYELAGEQHALAAFRAAQVSPSRERSWVRSRVAKLVIAALATGAAGGIAVVASAGTLPYPLARETPSATGGAHPGTSPAPSQSGSQDAGGGALPNQSPPVGPGASPTPPPSATAPPASSLTGLCHSYLSRRGASRDRALDQQSFAVLVTAAGGRENVTGYCVQLLADQPDAPGNGPKKSGQPHGSGQ